MYEKADQTHIHPEDSLATEAVERRDAGGAPQIPLREDTPARNAEDSAEDCFIDAAAAGEADEIREVPVPDDRVLIAGLDELRDRYPRMNTQALVMTSAFRSFAENLGYDLREITARFPEFIEGSRALAAAVESPVPRATGTAVSRRRTLLTPHQQRELAAWNRDNPQYKMSDVEYFNSLRNA